jgi:hypothetical protein
MSVDLYASFKKLDEAFERLDKSQKEHIALLTRVVENQNRLIASLISDCNKAGIPISLPRGAHADWSDNTTIEAP